MEKQGISSENTGGLSDVQIDVQCDVQNGPSNTHSSHSTQNKSNVRRGYRQDPVYRRLKDILVTSLSIGVALILALSLPLSALAQSEDLFDPLKNPFAPQATSGESFVLVDDEAEALSSDILGTEQGDDATSSEAAAATAAESATSAQDFDAATNSPTENSTTENSTTENNEAASFEEYKATLDNSDARDDEELKALASVTVFDEVTLREAVAASSTNPDDPTTIWLAGTIYLTNDALEIPEGHYVQLVGNADLYGAFMNDTLAIDGTLTLDGITVTHTREQSHTGEGVWVGNQGTFILKSGGVSGNSVGGVTNNGTFEMYGGYVSGNIADGAGPGVLNNGTFDMYGGEISFNTGWWGGGGVYNHKTFNMYGGTIRANYAGDSNVGNYGTFVMLGGEISSGGGVCSYNTFIMSGEALITDTSAENGGAVQVLGGTFTMLDDARIERGTATNNGGGVYVADDAAFIMEGGTVSSCWAGVSGGGVYVEPNATTAIQAGSILFNTAGKNGGGVWLTDTNVGLERLSVAAGVVFYGNYAQMPSVQNRASADDAVYKAHIGDNGEGVMWSAPFEQGYNNYDISYAPTITEAQVVVVSEGAVGASGSGEYAAGDLVLIDAGMREGYVFAGWTAEPSYAQLLSLTDTATAFYMPADAVTVTANWEPKNCLITYNANAGNGQPQSPNTIEGTMEQQLAAYDSKVTLSKNAFVSGRFLPWAPDTYIADVFLGWNTAPDGSGTPYTNEQVFDPWLLTDDTLTLYAMWAIPQVDPRVGLVEIIDGFAGYSGEGMYYKNDVVTINAGEREGYVFAGWTVDEVLGWFPPDEPGELVLEDSASATTTFVMPDVIWVTLTAHWAAVNSVTVNGSYAQTSGAGDYKQGDIVALDAGEREGYEFAGWTVDEGEITLIEPSRAATAFAMSSSAVTVTAQWEPKTFVITYVANQGDEQWQGRCIEGTMEPQQVTYGSAVTLNKNVFYSEIPIPWSPGKFYGDRFMMWNTAPDGSGTYYTDEQVIDAWALAGNVVLYAQWARVHIDPHFIPLTINDSYAEYSGEGIYAMNETVTINAGEREGYEFAGWTVDEMEKWSPDDTSELVIDDPTSAVVTFTMPDIVLLTLTAHWTAVNEAAVNEVAVNGSFALTSGAGSYKTGDTVTLAAGEREGYEFDGWTVDAGSATLLDAKSATTTFVMPDSSVTVTASWKPRTYTITFVGDPGYEPTIILGLKGKMENQTVVFGSEVKLAKNMFYSEKPIPWYPESTYGHLFLGWNTEPFGEGIFFSDEQVIASWSFAADTTLYAQWALITIDPPEFAVVVNDSFAEQSGSGIRMMTDTVVISAGEREGYVFAGWTVESEPLELDDPTSATTSFIMPDYPVTVTANWSAVNAVVVNGSRAEVSGADTYVQGDTVVINAGEYEDYVFAGWTVDEGTATLLDPSSETTAFVMPGSSVTVTAHWAAKPDDDEYAITAAGLVVLSKAQARALVAGGDKGVAAAEVVASRYSDGAPGTITCVSGAIGIEEGAYLLEYAVVEDNKKTVAVVFIVTDNTHIKQGELYTLTAKSSTITLTEDEAAAAVADGGLIAANVRAYCNDSGDDAVVSPLSEDMASGSGVGPLASLGASNSFVNVLAGSLGAEPGTYAVTYGVDAEPATALTVAFTVLETNTTVTGAQYAITAKNPVVLTVEGAAAVIAGGDNGIAAAEVRGYNRATNADAPVSFVSGTLAAAQGTYELTYKVNAEPSTTVTVTFIVSGSSGAAQPESGTTPDGGAAGNDEGADTGDSGGGTSDTSGGTSGNGNQGTAPKTGDNLTYKGFMSLAAGVLFVAAAVLFTAAWRKRSEKREKRGGF
ncbi:MAG: InlB B-repeat-containing protein [Coriobacteriia bacterium]|nr:InlB B-repeat-containing protein [Coriobacteriia bacterium]